jgi:hypothetical protein
MLFHYHEMEKFILKIKIFLFTRQRYRCASVIGFLRIVTTLRISHRFFGFIVYARYFAERRFQRPRPL